MTATDELVRDNAGKYVGLRQGEHWERTENSNYYCGGCGWKVTDHDSYCPECGGALHKAALDSSNCTNSERTSDELERENAKLRKLVRDMWLWRYEGHINIVSWERRLKHIDGVFDRMCELGIEVDE